MDVGYIADVRVLVSMLLLTFILARWPVGRTLCFMVFGVVVTNSLDSERWVFVFSCFSVASIC